MYSIYFIFYLGRIKRNNSYNDMILYYGFLFLIIPEKKPIFDEFLLLRYNFKIKF